MVVPRQVPDQIAVQQRRRASTRLKVQAHRQRLREQGLRPIQIWVPDVRLPGFEQEAARQCLLANVSSHETADQAFVDAVFCWPEPDAEG